MLQNKSAPQLTERFFISGGCFSLVLLLHFLQFLKHPCVLIL